MGDISEGMANTLYPAEKNIQKKPSQKVRSTKISSDMSIVERHVLNLNKKRK
jgi:hypothetical protein